MDIIIKEMTEEHIDDVIEIEKISFTTPWSKDSFVVEITQNMLAKYVVAEADGKIVGYGGIWLIIDEGHITNIAVHKDYRGLGIGKKIIEGLIDVCSVRNIRAMTLEVRKSNEVAKNLYKQYGFKEYGIRPKYYADDNEDAIIMWKRIDG
ncbi:ribosomal protein S18-alanine N-acetyltransferase [Anaerosalibacter sp. Marseille-P3206]|uniref:ribosomal protein S18-alanine N-acetyltransferase n=1 Tax=Anaerosalibacter sp. Marseille-P3206 TaxID=1871005 RepID=UPI0009874C6C|nr:ribosomal protein S18-alanine N-acetyltransferase [Anaerosalibacter sp. Marseille-P3206]